MPTSDATIQCNLACMYVKIFTERDINFFRVVTAILLKREETVFFTDRVGPGHFIYVTQHSIFYLIFIVGDDFVEIKLGSVAVVDNFCSHG